MKKKLIGYTILVAMVPVFVGMLHLLWFWLQSVISPVTLWEDFFVGVLVMLISYISVSIVSIPVFNWMGKSGKIAK